MAIRAGMTALIERLRGLCNAGVADYTIAGVTYWSDQQLQDILDMTQVQAYLLRLEALPQAVDGTWRYYDYVLPTRATGEIERDDQFVVRNSAGSAFGTALYSVNYPARRVTFSTDQTGLDIYADARFYDMNLAAAYCWEQKAGHAAARVDWSSDNHSVKASQMAAAYLEMARKYRGQSGNAVGVARFVRADEDMR